MGKKRIEYRRLPRYKYQLVGEYHHQTNIIPSEYVYSPVGEWFVSISPSGALVVKSGYAWDGASGPTLDTKSTMRASLVHDALYQLIRTEKLPGDARKKADVLLRDIMIVDGSGKFRASYYYRAVRWFGGKASRKRWKKHTKEYAP